MITAFLAQVLAPLSLGLVGTAIIAGLFLGMTYNYKLNIEAEAVFHKAVAGWAFIAFVFMYRVGTAVSTGVVVPTFFGWLGIGILWGIFCLSIFLGDRLAHKLAKLFKWR